MKGSVCFALLVALGAVSAVDVTPIGRCVQLLQNLGKQIEADSKKEQELFETFVCWGKGVIDTKTASNSAAESRIDMMKQYLADIDAGRVEFTSERQDLEKEIEELTADLEVARQMRTQENKDFEVAEDEMKKAVSALTSAVDVLNKATKNSTGSLLSVTVKTSASQGFAERAREGASLNHALELGQKFLSKGDAFFLRRLLTGEVPKADWKKLNRKATFKMKYKARSTKIQSVLAKLLQTFEGNLKDATDKEAAAKASYEKLKGTKDGQLDKAQKSLTKMEKENGAKGMSKADATKEVSDLETQVKNDIKFISDTQASLATKTTEWKARQVIRAGESAAISQAISILASDDAKDNFKKSASSQGFFFLQTAQSSALITRAAQQIQETARATSDIRLKALLRSTMGNAALEAVVKAIDTMIATLKDDEKKDLSNKQTCEADRMKNVRDAVNTGRLMDELTDSLASLAQDIKELNTELAATKAELKAATDEINEAEKQRKAEKAEWKISDADDQQASETVGSAVDVLSKFYKDNGFMLVQKKAGQAPPPPTWEGSYEGKTSQAGGILGILKLCQEDIDKDRASAKADEDKAQAAYDKARTEFETQEKALNKAIGSLDGKIGAKEQAVEDAASERNTKKGMLDATLKMIANADPGCNYIEVNYPLRVKNRQIEIDGLLKAKAILSGGSFTAPADDSREIKPGDAFLQIRRH